MRRGRGRGQEEVGDHGVARAPTMGPKFRWAAHLVASPRRERIPCLECRSGPRRGGASNENLATLMRRAGATELLGAAPGDVHPAGMAHGCQAGQTGCRSTPPISTELEEGGENLVAPRGPTQPGGCSARGVHAG